MFRKNSLFAPLIALLAACSQAPAPEGRVPSTLAPMFGSTGRDAAFHLARHSSGVYVVGYTGSEIFVRQSDASGSVLWERHFSASAWTLIEGAASDSSSNVYVVGTTEGDLAGQRRRKDVFVRKYTPSGGVAWMRQLGTSRDDWTAGMTVVRPPSASIARTAAGRGPATAPGEVA